MNNDVRNVFRVSRSDSTAAACEASSYGHIASAIVHVQPAHLDSLERQLYHLENVTVHAVDASGKLILTLETASEAAILAHLDAIGQYEGVLGTYLVYHHAEPLGALEEPVCHD